MFSFIPCELLLSIGFTIIVCAIILYFCYIKFTALDNAIAKQNAVLSDFISSVKYDVNISAPISNMNTDDALSAAIEFNTLNNTNECNVDTDNKIQVTDDEDDTDDDSDDDSDDSDNDSDNDDNKNEN